MGAHSRLQGVHCASVAEALIDDRNAARFFRSEVREEVVDVALIAFFSAFTRLREPAFSLLGCTCSGEPALGLE